MQCNLFICSLCNLVLSFFTLCANFLCNPRQGGEEEVWEGNGEVLQLPGEAAQHVREEEGAAAPGGTHPCLPAPPPPLTPHAHTHSPAVPPPAETKHAQLETCLLFSLPCLFLLLRLWPPDRATFHWRASQRHFSWPVQRGNMDSLVLFGPKVKCGCCAVWGRNSALCRKHSTVQSQANKQISSRNSALIVRPSHMFHTLWRPLKPQRSSLQAALSPLWQSASLYRRRLKQIDFHIRSQPQHSWTSWTQHHLWKRCMSSSTSVTFLTVAL